MSAAESSVSGYGGARKGAGRKTKAQIAERERAIEAGELPDYNAARARKEEALADLNELDYAIKSGEYVARIAVRQAAATALAALTQTLRGVPDNLERRLGVAPEVAEAIGKEIDSALADLASEFEAMAGDE